MPVLMTVSQQELSATAQWPVPIIAVIVAGFLGLISPRVLERVPEPVGPDDDKRSYAELAHVQGVAIGSAAMSAMVVLILAERIAPAGLIVWTFVVPFGVLLSYVDWHTRLLPKRLVIPGTCMVAVLVVVMAIIEQNLDTVVAGAITAAAVFAVFFAMWLIYPRGLGYGDVRLTGSLGMALGVLGVAETIVGVYAGFLIGAICAVALSALRLVNPRQFAFGPYLVIGAVIGAGWGPSLAALI